MKKLLLIAAIGVAGLVSAATTTTNKTSDLAKTIRYFEIISKSGFAAYDTADKGTCFVYGTYITDTSSGVTIFKAASLATQATIVAPPCTGEGSYLV
ncbi:hypothetical protein BAZ12_00650 [Elizabethkingia miricola]|uniref:hypothetical protein n=1 Tax=Elizabethkingia TaxID=308865 RepID=UPI00083FE598|nr:MULTISPECIES: hypothetical protein [Elizabethkingia]MCL1652576.1 hypothetical protein [Elizabethkingia miricola]OCW73140.1 hypothetical protein A4G24_15810 [Elizabethkingia anophelis]OPC71123.1 hypothetical protein BAZ13_09750 [Elizabethkingia miricola]OPC75584.1 hypothetical protein BAZ12_00650 [Elizabethkingia miricola]